jgi:hypothetical protein
MQASTGMFSVDCAPQNGQISSDLMTGTLGDALAVMGKQLSRFPWTR